ncbi:MAG TPA: hypothetical protein DHV59_10015 [Oxalobacteraceae bacterium]|nr:hypothetical protein [Oxalobacteraceae bacterium]
MMLVKHIDAQKGFVLLPRRWVVERSFGRAARFFRLARDFEPMAVIVLTYLMVTIGLLLSLCAQIPCRFSFFTLAGFWPMPHSQSLFSW